VKNKGRYNVPSLPLADVAPSNMIVTDWHASYRYCNKNFANYGRFATLPLRLAVVKGDEYSLETFESDLVECQKHDLEDDRRLRGFIRSLIYEDSNFFTLDELRYCMSLGLGRMTFLSDEQIEASRQLVLDDLKGHKNMLEFHATTMLRAIDFWKLRFNDYFDKWTEEYGPASIAQTVRLQKTSSATNSYDESDDGYYSDGESVLTQETEDLVNSQILDKVEDR
jgi:hypothetical protein